MSDAAELLAVGVFIGLVAGLDVYVGRIIVPPLPSRWRPVYRDEQPFLFWASIVLFGAFALIFGAAGAVGLLR
jgi:hypothetical protein